MSWTLSVSARKGDFATTLKDAEARRADSTDTSELSDGEQAQVAAVKALARAAFDTYDEDNGLVGLYARGGVGASGALVVNLSVASEPHPVAHPGISDLASEEPARNVTRTEVRETVGRDYAHGRPEEPGGASGTPVEAPSHGHEPTLGEQRRESRAEAVAEEERESTEAAELMRSTEEHGQPQAGEPAPAMQERARRDAEAKAEEPKGGTKATTKGGSRK